MTTRPVCVGDCIGLGSGKAGFGSGLFHAALVRRVHIQSPSDHTRDAVVDGFPQIGVLCCNRACPAVVSDGLDFGHDWEEPVSKTNHTLVDVVILGKNAAFSFEHARMDTTEDGGVA